MQSHCAKLLRAALTASLVLVAIAGAAVAGPLEDALAARDRGDDATALRLIRPLADQGNAEAQYNLGIMYVTGESATSGHSLDRSARPKSTSSGFMHRSKRACLTL